MKILLYVMTLMLTSCSHSRDIIMHEEYESVNYTFNDDISFGFNIPNNSIDILPSDKHKNHNEFSIEDITNTKNELVWILNKTYHNLPQLTYSGKYSIRVGAAIADISDSNLSLQQLEQIKKKHYEDKFDLDLQMERYWVKNHEEREWLVKRHVYGKQKTITAYTLLDGRTYLSFSFEYFGKEDEEFQSLLNMYEKVLKSFWTKDKKTGTSRS